MNKKRVIILISSILISVILVVTIVTLYQTYATNVTIVLDNENIYDVNLNDITTITVPAKTSKTIYYKVTNTNKGAVRYGVGYSSQDGLIVKYYEDSIDTHTGIMEMNENKFIKLKIINDTESEGEITLSTILGYENDENLIAPADVNPVTGKIASSNYMEYLHYIDTETGNTFFLNTSLLKTEIESITTVSDDIVPSDIPQENIFDVSQNRNGTVTAWYKDTDGDSLYEVYIGSGNGKISVKSCSSLFYQLTNLNSIDLKYLDTSGVENFSNMFWGCSNLETLDLSSFNTSNATSFASMFRECSKLKTVNLQSFNTSNVTTLDSMFRDCTGLTELDLSNFNTSSVNNMQYMFISCTGLTTLDLSNFNTSNVTNMLGMFRYCNLTHLDLRNFTFKEGVNATSMFNGCSKLEYLDIRNANFNNISSFSDMFSNTKANATIYVLDEDQVTWFQTNFSGMTNVNIF